MAQSKPGRLEQMQALFEQLGSLTERRTNLENEKDALEEAEEEAGIRLAKQIRRYKQAQGNRDNVLSPPAPEEQLLAHDDGPTTEQLTREQRAQRRAATAASNGGEVAEEMHTDDPDAQPPLPAAEAQASDAAAQERAAAQAAEQEAAQAALLSELAEEIAAAGQEIARLRPKYKQAKRSKRQWVAESYEPAVEKLRREVEKIQRTLKPLCAQVRNEYSTGELQKDFKAGFTDLTRQDAEDMENDEDEEREEEEQEGWGAAGDRAAQQVAASPAAAAGAPDDKELDVFCISANDYLKVTKIKDRSDGPPVTFHRAQDTNIPTLTRFVHQVTLDLV